MRRDPISIRDVLRLAGPMAIAMLSHTTMSVIDTIWVGRLGTDALAAVGLTTSLVFLVIMPAYGLMDGVRVSTSHRTGAGDEAGARSIGRAGLVMAMALATLSLLAIPVTTLAVAALSDAPEVVRMGRAYLSIRLYGAPIGIFSCAATAWFQGRGDTRTPMVASLITTLLNLILDPLFIFGLGPVPALGVGGAALATVIGMTASAVFLLVRLAPHIRGAEVSLRRELPVIWGLGAPIALRSTLEVGSYVGVASMLTQVGSVHMAAHIMVVRLLSTSFLPGHAVSQACKVLVGQAVGAGDPQRAREAIRCSMQLALGVMTTGAALFVGAPESLLSVFAPEPEALEIAVDIARLAGLLQVIDAVAMVTLGALEGAGETRFSMGVSIAGTWLIKLPIAVACTVGLGWGAWGAWLGFTAEVAFQAAMGSWRVHRWLPCRPAQSSPVVLV